MSFEIKKIVPKNLLYTSILNQLSKNGKTIFEIDYTDKLVSKGYKSQKQYANDSVWYTLENVRQAVAKELMIGSDSFGCDRKNNYFYKRTLDVIHKLRESGIITDWSKNWKLAFRLTDNNFHIVRDIVPPSYICEPPQYTTKSKIKFGEEEDMKRIFTYIMIDGEKDNTYKFTLAKIILEYCERYNSRDIKYEYLAEQFLKHYWHQKYKYNLKQNFKTKDPHVIQEICRTFGDNPPADYNLLDEDKIKEAKNGILKNVFGHARRDTSLVVPRFQNILDNGDNLEYKIFYNYDDDRTITIKPESLKLLKENYDSLYPIPILSWAKLLDEINHNKSNIKKFLEDQKIILNKNIEDALIEQLEKISITQDESDTVKEFCNKLKMRKEDSLILLSTKSNEASSMFRKTTKEPVPLKNLQKYNIPKNITKRKHVSMFGIRENYDNIVDGATVLFYDNTKIHSYAKILAKFKNSDIVKEFWGFGESNSLSILFLTKIDTVNMSKEMAHLFTGKLLNNEIIFSSKHNDIIKKFGNVERAIHFLNTDIDDVTITLKPYNTKVRIGQDKFRKMVLENFNGRCAVCGLSDEDLLEAAHIKPVKDDCIVAGKVSNGLCLCVMHHSMFDKYFFAINGEYKVFRTKTNTSENCSNLLNYKKIQKPKQELDPQYLDMRLAKAIKKNINFC